MTSQPAFRKYAEDDDDEDYDDLFGKPLNGTGELLGNNVALDKAN